MRKYIFLCLFIGLGQLLQGCSMDKMSFSSGDNGTGTGGSMARFTILGNNLYVVDQNNLRTFDISRPATPRPTATVSVGMGIETIFPYNNNLFIGSNSAMFIYNLDNPAQPKRLSVLPHITGRGCDPVVAQGNYAYVTLRAATAGCGRRLTTENVMFVIDISNLSNPRTLKVYAVSSPYGIGIRGNALFLCEGAAGLRVFDATDPVELVQKSFLTEVKSYDVIPLPASLLVIGEDGFYQYDYTDLTKLQLLSKIPVTK